MQIIAGVLLLITSFSMIVRKEGIVFGLLFFISIVVGFITFGFVKGLGYLALLIVSSLFFHLIERFLSMHTAIKLAREDMKKKIGFTKSGVILNS